MPGLDRVHAVVGRHVIGRTAPARADIAPACAGEPCAGGLEGAGAAAEPPPAARPCAYIRGRLDLPGSALVERCRLAKLLPAPAATKLNAAIDPMALAKDSHVRAVIGRPANGMCGPLP
jgi:hypothetical protein